MQAASIVATHAKMKIFFIFEDLKILLNYPDAQFVERIDRECDEEEREGIAGGSDECSEDEDGDEDVSPVVFEVLSAQDAEFGEQPRDDRHFKEQSHQDGQNEQQGDIGAEADLIGDRRADLVGA